MEYSRRDFGKLALAGVPAAAFLLKSELAFGAPPKANSKWAGVQVGLNVPYSFGGGNYMSGDEILDRCLTLGISGLELRAQPVELFLGSPEAVAGAAAQAAGGRGRGGARAAAPGAAADAAGGGAAAGGRGRGRAAGAAAGDGGRAAAGAAPAGSAPCVPGSGIPDVPPAEPAAAGPRAGGAAAGGRGAQTPEQQAAADATRRWRMGVSMAKVKEFRKKYEDAGVMIDIVKWDGIYGFSDDELDYAFEVSKALGARSLSSEISIGQTKRIGQFADKHKMQVGYHGHTAVTPAIWEATFAEAKYNAANVDLGHYVAGNNTSPVPFIKKYANRITHVHVKDRKYCNGPNVAFGQGDTPVKEVLQLMRQNKWQFDATIEFEIPLAQGQDRMTEIAKCVDYCKNCLLS